MKLLSLKAVGGPFASHPWSRSDMRILLQQLKSRFSKSRIHRRRKSGMGGNSPAGEVLECRALLSAVTMNAHEQLMVELINRARANPSAEASRYSIGLNKDLPSGTITTAAKQPLAPEQILTDVAALHSADMIDRDFFSHVNPDGDDWNDRADAGGYPLDVAENLGIQGTTTTLDKTAATFAMHEWLFKSPIHRPNILDDDYVEVGIGLEEGVWTDTGNLFGNGAGVDYNAWLGTQNYSIPSKLYITGVAYHDDVTSDDFYTVGEGHSSGTITVMSATGTITSSINSVGGYQVEVPAAGDYVVLFKNGSNIYIDEVTVVDENVKVDFETTTAQLAVSSDSATETVTVVGTALTDTIRVNTATKRVTFNGMVTVHTGFANPTFNVDGGGGLDFIDAYLTTGVETVSAGPDLATNLTVTGASNVTGNAEIIKVYSQGGEDTMHLYDRAASNDTFIARPDLSYMLHDGSMAPLFQTYAYDFANAVGHASGTTGGYSDGAGDIAQLYDSAGNDFATAWPTAARLTDNLLDPASRTYFTYAANFDYVNFWATAGGHDEAEFYDAATDDLYVSRVTSGNHPQTYLRDLAGGADFFNVANRFDRTTAYATGGNDQAQFYDTFGDDLYIVNGPNDVYMSTGGQLFSYAKNFEQTIGFSTRGGTDSAQFYDGPGNDLFTAHATSSTLESISGSSSFSHSQSGFDSVLAYAREAYADSDVLNIAGSTGYAFTVGGSWENDGSSSSGPIPQFDALETPVTPNVEEIFLLDADGDGTTEALTDGILFLQQMAGFENVPVSTGIVDPSIFLDVDGDGEVKALTDGMLILRFLAGFRGESLINGAVDAGGSRITATRIETWLSPFVVAPPAVVATGGFDDSVIRDDSFIVTPPPIEEDDESQQSEIRTNQIQPLTGETDDLISPPATDQDASPRPLY